MGTLRDIVRSPTWSDRGGEGRASLREGHEGWNLRTSWNSVVLGGKERQMAGRGTLSVNLPQGSLVEASTVEIVWLGQGLVGLCFGVEFFFFFFGGR